MSLNLLSGTLLPGTLTKLSHGVANHLWQSTVVACIAGLLTLTLRRNHARARYALWLTASVKFLVPFSLLMAMGGHLASLRHATAQRQAAAQSFVAIEQLSQPFTTAPEFIAPHRPNAPTAISVADRVAAIWRGDPLLPALAATAWLIGVLFISVRWIMRWRRISAAIQLTEPLYEGREFEILERMRQLACLRCSIELRPLAASMEPGIFGLFRPILLWPHRITARLEDTHLEAVLAHEVCHVRRRDNLTAALHMLVEALFWFHPLVWWLETRLVAERENACDEEVLALCGHSRIYAESILKVCEFCVETPLACVSGVTGADLKRRIAQILADRTILKLTLAKKLLLAATAMLVVAVPIMLGQATGAQRMAIAALRSTPAPIRAIAHTIAEAATTQPAESTAPAPILQQDTPASPASDSVGLAFDVASIRPSVSSPVIMRWQPTNDGLIAQTFTLKMLIAYAYGVLPEYVVGGRAWTGSQQYDINAKLSGKEADTFAGLPPNQKAVQTSEMLRTLLADRFQLKVRREVQESASYTLVLAKGSPNLTKSPPLEPDAEGHMPPDAGTASTMLDGRHIMRRTSMLMFAKGLSSDPEVAREVVDQTGLKGPYDFEYKWKPSQDGSGPSLFTVLQEQLGLKLVPGKRAIKAIFIEKAEKPSVDGIEVPEQTSAVTSQTSNTPYVPTMTFDVASVRESNPGPEMHLVGGRFTPHTTDLKLENVDLFWLISLAYGVDYHQITGQPDWAGRASFTVEAKSDAAADKKMATLDKDKEKLEQQHMVQVFLAERFNLATHWEVKEGKIYNLVLTKGGSKLRPAGSLQPPPGELKWLGDSKTPPPIHQQGDGKLGYEFYGHDCPVEDLVRTIGSMMGREVVNQTGLTGKFDFHIQYHGSTPRDNSHEDPTVWPPLTDALEDQLGLKLEAGKGQVRFLVVDHVDKPSPN